MDSAISCFGQLCPFLSLYSISLRYEQVGNMEVPKGASGSNYGTSVNGWGTWGFDFVHLAMRVLSMVTYLLSFFAPKVSNIWYSLSWSLRWGHGCSKYWPLYGSRGSTLCLPGIPYGIWRSTIALLSLFFWWMSLTRPVISFRRNQSLYLTCSLSKSSSNWA